ncbi:MAG: CarD family transcriptional regulator, partial [Campylobacterota bacterium]|nr:CarD family transcriptional regulator [Campylobacterota bacterium]
QRTVGEECEVLHLVPAFYSLDNDAFERISKEVEASESDSFVKDIASLGFWYLDDLAEDFLQEKKSVFIKPMHELIEEALIESLPVIAEPEHHTSLAVTDVPTLLKVHQKKKITLIAMNEAQIKAAGVYETDTLHVRHSSIILNIISDDELIISLNKPTKKKRRRKSSIILDDLKPGDYVVHEEYGVGVFEKIEQAEILGGVKDFVTIRYQGDDKVLLPVENLDSIDRYIASGTLPTLDRLGMGVFVKIKDK